jgi:large subunit ribosomal protein L22
MSGPKLNEGATVAGERAGTKATARYLRSSASKARVVLDLIRGLDVRRADEVLQFTERGIARDVRKVLASAVANAVHNDEQDADELFVIACFADEGPTLKRFRPRARGRATRVRKRTCHITVVVARMSDERIAVVQARQAGAHGGRGRPTSSAASRRARVERSRQRAQAAAAATRTPAESEDAVDTTEELAEDIAEELEAEIDAVEAQEAAEDAAADAESSGAAEDEIVADEESGTVAEEIEAEGPSTEEDEPGAAEGSASDEADSDEENRRADEEGI